jgi:hypothetical protein
VRSLNELAAEILSDDKLASWESVRHVGRLLLAYADYNCAATDSTVGRGRATSEDPRRAVAGLIAGLKDVQAIHEDCERAWDAFQNAEWPSGATDVWRANEERFCEVLERNTRALEDLRRKHFGEPGR